MARLKSQVSTAVRNVMSQAGTLDMDKKIKALENDAEMSTRDKVSSQTPAEKRKRRQRRFHMLRSKAV
jgi:hypothetical protein